jgi:hypothetical protein
MWEVACDAARGQFLAEIKFDEFFAALQRAPALRDEIERRVRALLKSKKPKPTASADKPAPAFLEKALAVPVDDGLTDVERSAEAQKVANAAAELIEG